MAASELGLGVGKSKYASPLRVVSQIAIVLWVSGHNPLWFFKVTYFQGLSLNVYIKVGMPDMAFISQGKASGWEIFLSCGTLYQGGFYGEIVSQPLLPTSMWSSSHLTNM